MVFDFFVIGGSINFRWHSSTEIRYFLGTLIYQYDHEVTVRVIFFHPFCDVMENRRFASPRRRHDQSSLAFANWTEEVKHPSGHSSVLRFQVEFVLRLDGCQLIKTKLLLSLLQSHAVHRMNVADLGVLTALVRVGIGLDDGAFS